jgi:chlorobactene glucosyltransferase
MEASMFAGFLYQHLLGIIFFISVQLFIGIVNSTGMRRLNENYRPARSGFDSPGKKSYPKVSVLVPARNEAAHIEACARSLLEQNYLNYELIILDDQSQDGTGEILHWLQNEQPRLSVMQGRALPEGWVGKTWACHQLAQAARGEYLLFTDADTRHHPHMLSEAISIMLSQKIDLMTGMPRQEVGTWGERLVVPFLSWIIFAVVPVPLARRVRFTYLSAAVGQFMFFQRDAYLKIGGHRAVLDTSLEDIALARLVKQHGLRWDFLDLSERVVCRMYQDFRSAFNGISKNLFGVFQYNLPVFTFAWIWLLLVFVEPSVIILAAAAGLPVSSSVLELAVAAAGLSVLLWGLNHVKFRLPLIMAAFYPLTMSLLFMMAVRSAWYHYNQRPFDWKGRDLPLSK